MKIVELVIFDLDNTLYDWYGAFIPAFYAMIDRAVEIGDFDRDRLLEELRNIHVQHRNVEHPFSLLETGSYRNFETEVGTDVARRAIDPAFHIFNSTRKHRLTLFPGVLETLRAMRARSVKLAAFTDSSYFAARHRIERLDLAQFFSHVFCRARAFVPGAISEVGEREEHWRFVELPANEAKPDPAALEDIARRENVAIDRVVYVGDSLAKDVLMAKRAGCLAVWAKYGARVDQGMYEQLIRISHWSSDDIERERRLAGESKSIAPDFICEDSLEELLLLFAQSKSDDPKQQLKFNAHTRTQ